jgi:hypothetical protein
VLFADSSLLWRRRRVRRDDLGNELADPPLHDLMKAFAETCVRPHAALLPRFFGATACDGAQEMNASPASERP